MLKNDRWIIEQAEQGMITPFVPNLVREVELDGKLRKVISYGLSSYGYDLRLSPSEFKVFRHIPGTVVNPKRFNAHNLEAVPLHSDEDGDFFIIPAHSYGLGVALERLVVPENISVLCIGKCLTGDTRIVDAASGAYLPIQEFLGGHTASYSDTQGVIKTPATSFIPQGVKPVFQVTTEKGATIKATAKHPFLTEQGWKPLDSLEPGTQVATPRNIPIFGNGTLTVDEAILLGLMISEGQWETPGHRPCLTSEDEGLVSLLRSTAQSGRQQLVTSKGRNFDYRLVNQIGRGGLMTPNRANPWLRSPGLDVKADPKFVPQSVFMAPRTVIAAFLRALFSGDGSVYLVEASRRENPTLAVEYCSTSERLLRDVHHLLLRFGIPSQIRVKQPARGRAAYILAFQAAESIMRFFTEIGFLPGSMKQQHFEKKMYPILLQTKPRQPLHDPIVWDTVKSIRAAGKENVYDISVPELENFIANDLIVHNSTYARVGLIANLTPAEAGWRGHLTLEFSNSSSADCRIYPNEGVCQLLFFEGEPCQTSYAARSGKYQDQPCQVIVAKV
jgi:deoxycytidine triphosphate deaminase